MKNHGSTVRHYQSSSSLLPPQHLGKTAAEKQKRQHFCQQSLWLAISRSASVMSYCSQNTRLLLRAFEAVK